MSHRRYLPMVSLVRSSLRRHRTYWLFTRSTVWKSGYHWLISSPWSRPGKDDVYSTTVPTDNVLLRDNWTGFERILTWHQCREGWRRRKKGWEERAWSLSVVPDFRERRRRTRRGNSTWSRRGYVEYVSIRVEPQMKDFLRLRFCVTETKSRVYREWTLCLVKIL